MPGLLPNIDPDGLLEYSVVSTDRSLNHMSLCFQEVMKTISTTLKNVYRAKSVAIVPGGGTFAMEAVARQFANDKKCLVIRNGWFSFRWSQILDSGNIPSKCTVLKARRLNNSTDAAFAPPPIQTVLKTIEEISPDLVFAPHGETSSGIILPDSYISSLSDAVHSVGGLLVLDCIASGAIWVNMKNCGVDILLSAPQKSWSSSPSSGLVMFGPLALERIRSTSSTSFACDLHKWLQIMEAYEGGGYAYHTTMPTDSLLGLYNMIQKMEKYGFEKLHKRQQQLGNQVRALLVSKGIKSVAAEGFQAPGVVVSYTDKIGIHNGDKFLNAGLQIAAGVPLACDEPEDFKTFRLGLFGFDKLLNIDRTIETLNTALSQIF